jgi:hypothetical protein
MTWPFKLASALAAAAGGALLGWALSLTQGFHAERWPWAVVGGIAILIVALVITEVIMQPENEDANEEPRPGGVSIWARKIVNTETGKILASGPGSFIDLVSDDVANSGTIRTDDDNGTDLSQA